MRARLTARIAAAVAVVGFVFLASVVVLAISIIDLRDSADEANQTERTLGAAQEVGALVIDVETGVRGYALTEQQTFLQPLDAAAKALPAATKELLDRPTASRNQQVLARAIADAATSYVDDYARPLITTISDDPGRGRDRIVTGAGKRRVDALRADIETLSSAVQQVADDRMQAAESHAERALWIALVAGVLSAALFVALILYLARSVAEPIRRVSRAAEKLGAGDLGVRVNERRSDEIGQLGDAFNAMGDALLTSSTELESQHAELETQNGELERQAVELESQAVELEAQAAELEAGQHELGQANESLLAQTETLERASAELHEASKRVETFAHVAESLGRHSALQDRADTLLAAVGDLSESPVGTLFSIVDHASDEKRAVSVRGVSTEDLSPVLMAGDGLAGRAIGERRTVIARHGEGDLKLRSLGSEVSLRHELHTPLVHADEIVGVLSLGRTDDRPYAEDEIAAIEHLVEQGAVAIVNSVESQRSQWLADLNRAVLDSTGDGIYMMGLDGQRIVSNPEMERFIREVLCEGYEVKGLDAGELQPIIEQRMADPDAYRERIAAILADPVYEGVEEFQFSDTGRWVRRYTAPVRTRAGEQIGRIFVYSETTETHEAQRVKDELMATVSHELRTPLSAILGFTELLMARDYPAEERKEYLATVHQQASRLSDLISDFLDLQRLEHSDEGVNLRPIDLREILASQVKLFSAQSNRHALQLKAAQQADLAIEGDADRLRRALANLISNAIKYSPDGGEVTVDATRVDDNVTISVTDRGLGIPSEAQERIFDRFFRVDNSATSRIGGTGLGLSLVREIVRAHHGEVGFDSVEGQGSRFWMKVPVAASTDRP
ncbi:MAG: ATP-binding protein [Solirubrobacteraceae bacterium]|nr:ATP-binding protein [Solirubrobacteraceae bacterium]